MIKSNQNIPINEYRREIDGLRAFAIIAVIVNHFNKDILPSGYLGVDIFFVISGYVITCSIARRNTSNLKDFITSFYYRRVKRLIPGLLVFILITSFLICFFDPSSSGDLITGGSSLFGVSNIALYIKSKDYFSSSIQFNPFAHTWSLGVEEQFYFLFPLITWFTGYARKTSKGSKNLVIVVSILCVISLISFIYKYESNQPAAYFLMPNRFWEIASGSLLFIVSKKKRVIINFIKNISPNYIIIGMLITLFLPLKFAVISTIVMVLLTLLMLACLQDGTYLYRVFTQKSIVYIGVISYSLYLWHWGVLAISRWTIGVNSKSVIVQILIILLLSVLTYELVEKRFKYQSPPPNKIKSMVLILLSSILTGGFIFLLRDILQTNLYLGEKSENSQVNILNSRKFFVVGDSHALDILNLLKKNKNFKTVDLTVGGCHFYYNGESNAEPRMCKKQILNKNRLLKEVNKGDVVIIASNYFPSVMNSKNKTNPKIYNKMIGYLENVLPVLESKEVNAILKLPHPKVNNPEKNVGNGLICKKEKFRPNINPGCYVEGINKKDFLLQRSYFLELINEFSSKYKHLYLWEITNITCPTLKCYPTIDGEAYIVDSHHLFITSPKLTEELVNSLNKILLVVKESK